MDKQELRDYCQSLWAVDSIDKCMKLMNIFHEFFFLVIQKHHEDKVYTQPKADAKMILQMMFTKSMHINKLLGSVGFKSKQGGKLNPIIDPTVIASLVRNLYETVCLFHLIYMHPDSTEKHSIVYQLWVSSGLKYRQRFNATLPTSVEKLEQEAKVVESIKKQIEGQDYFKSLTEQNQKKILNKLKDKDYKICFEGDEVKFLSWQAVSETMNLKNDLFDQIYTYFSLYSHPSNVAMFQFENMFSKEDEAFKSLTTTSMKYCFTLLSIFIADYIKVFPQIQETYNAQEIQDQILMNFHNHMMRDEKFSINDSWKALE
jgi:predicted transcriptional regulator with HTH domain